MTDSPNTASPRPDLTGFVAGLPKAELHVHHIGSASPRIVGELASRHPGVVPSDPDELREYMTFRDFGHFIEVYLSVVDLVRTPEDVEVLTYEIGREMAAGQNIRYAELTCTPYTSVVRGIAYPDYVAALERARVAVERDCGTVLRWVFDVPGEEGVPGADATIGYLEDHPLPEALVGFGLGGPEQGVPRPQFRPHFERARALGLRSVPHAGETTGPQTVRDAITELGADRLGHGTSAAQDPELLTHLAAAGIPLEVCPSSNVATGAVPSLAEHPLAAFVEAGVPVTINSDDPPMFGTTLNHEYEVAADLLDLDGPKVADLALAAVEFSFADHDVRRRLVGEIRDYAAQHGLLSDADRSLCRRGPPSPCVAGLASGHEREAREPAAAVATRGGGPRRRPRHAGRPTARVAHQRRLDRHRRDRRPARAARDPHRAEHPGGRHPLPGVGRAPAAGRRPADRRGGGDPDHHRGRRPADHPAAPTG